ncbi:hypothetical protein NQZ68_012639 [Dissostichus eleginoides]|nr:hypothetical protein NQZ68_012639 [Dissostichus eleginoides]
MTREETQTENGLWEKKRTQRGLYNCMFCLERRVCTSVNHHQGASAEQMAEEGIEPVIDFVSAEGRKTERTESKTILHIELCMDGLHEKRLIRYGGYEEAGCDHSHTPSSNKLPKILHKLLVW